MIEPATDSDAEPDERVLSGDVDSTHGEVSAAREAISTNLADMITTPTDAEPYSVTRPVRHYVPQQAREPPVITPQVWELPALTEENSPAGGEALP